MQQDAKLCDVFIYVLDARAPYSCLNPEFIKVIGTKPIIYVLNKSDLADNKQTNEWVEYFEKLPNSKVVTMNSTESKSANIIVRLINELLSKRKTENEHKGINYIFRAMVLGVPNCGKSTLINNLIGKGRLTTGDKPGVTRSKQWAKLNSTLEIMDTPGTLWPSFDNEKLARNLVYIGSIKDDILDLERMALDFIKDIVLIDKEILSNKYSIEVDGKTPIEIYDNIAKSRGCILKRDEIDYTRCAKMILTDYRKGALGKITLDKVEDVQ